MNENPLVSILIPTYNRPHYFREALESALAQTYKNIEIIVSDDSDNEETYELIQEYLMKYECIRYFRNPEITCMADNLVFCVGQAGGEYVQILMDDDLIYPDKIKVMLDVYLKNPMINLVTSCQDIVDECSSVTEISTKIKRKSGVIVGKKAMDMFFQHKYSIIVGYPNAPLLRLNHLREFLYESRQWYKEGRFAFYDVGLWIYLWKNGDMMYIAEPLSAYRMHINQATHKLEVDKCMWILHWKSLMYCRQDTGVIDDVVFRGYVYKWLSQASEIAALILVYDGLMGINKVPDIFDTSLDDCFKEAFACLK